MPESTKFPLIPAMPAIMSKSSITSVKNLTTNPSNNAKIWAGLITLYFIWGSTYLAIRFVVESVPPMLVSGMRTTLAGLILYSFGRFLGRHYTKPQRSHWKTAAITGLLMITVGNGAITLAARLVPSSFSALFGALVPVIMTLLVWYFTKKRPNSLIFFGCLLGITGVSLLMSLNHLALKGQEANLGWGIVLLLLGNLGWSLGVLLTSRAHVTLSPATMSGMQLMIGGAVSLLISTCLGELSLVHVESITLKSILSFLYLLSFGSLLGFSVFGWLTQNADPTLVATYTYVNPLVALTLGFLLAGESLNPLMLAAAFLIVGAVVLITRGKRETNDS